MMVSRPCPSCDTDIVMGVSMTTPVVSFALTKAQIEKKRLDVISAIDESSMTAKEKTDAKALLPEGAAIHPEEADQYIQYIKTTYAKIEEPKKPAKKK